jgi:Helix-turn-helix domain
MAYACAFSFRREAVPQLSLDASIRRFRESVNPSAFPVAVEPGVRDQSRFASMYASSSERRSQPSRRGVLVARHLSASSGSPLAGYRCREVAAVSVASRTLPRPTAGSRRRRRRAGSGTARGCRAPCMGARVEVVLNDEERKVLERSARRPKSSQPLALRCRIVLAAAEGGPSTEIAASLACTRGTVGRWRGRFASRGFDGLHDEPRPRSSYLLQSSPMMTTPSAPAIGSLPSVCELTTHDTRRRAPRAPGRRASAGRRGA